MLLRTKTWWYLLGAIIALRIVNMIFLPFIDTSEPRYAEIARIMAVSGDWITPWFSPGVPFWGKPPLAFWSEALAFNLFGFSEFAARLPSLLANLVTTFFIYIYARRFFSLQIAQWSALIYSTFALTYVAAGAVITDPFMTTATAGAAVCFAMAGKEPQWYWRYGFFAALALGLLAKGPLMLVLAGGALLPLALLDQSVRHTAKKLPWFLGLCVTGAIALPWYVMAEIKTPGFLNYFIVGEHFLRFVDPGWAGDLYGNAHRRVKGTIWIYALLASIPWGPLFLVQLFRLSKNRDQATPLRAVFRDTQIAYLAVWSLFPLLFFTAAGNILWTYTLPALPPLSVLIALALHKHPPLEWRRNKMIGAMLCAVPLLVSIFTAAIALQPRQMKSEKDLISFVMKRKVADAQLAYLGKIPFSAQFYSNGNVSSLSMTELKDRKYDDPILYLAVPVSEFKMLSAQMKTPLPSLFENKRYILTVLAPHNSAVESHADKATVSRPDKGQPLQNET